METEININLPAESKAIESPKTILRNEQGRIDPCRNKKMCVGMKEGTEQIFVGLCFAVLMSVKQLVKCMNF